MKIKLRKVARTSGHFSAKLAVTNPDGSETWFDYDTRGQTVEPTGTIMVFDSSRGVYEAARDLAHAKQLFAQHTARLTVTEPINPPREHRPVGRGGEPVAVTIAGLSVRLTTLETPAEFVVRPFDLASNPVRNIVTGGTVRVAFPGSALPDEILAPGEVWPRDHAYPVTRFIASAETPGAAFYCLIPHAHHRIATHPAGAHEVAGVRFDVIAPEYEVME
jgi:hypothetical protein